MIGAMPFLASRACEALNYTNFGSVGTCVVEATMFGDVVLAGIIMMAMFSAMIVRYNFPVQLIVPMVSALSYTLYLMSGNNFFLVLLILSLIVMGGVLILGLLNYINRG